MIRYVVLSLQLGKAYSLIYQATDEISSDERHRVVKVHGDKLDAPFQ